jgi:hypothetical protein
VLGTALGACSTYGVVDVMLPLYAKRVLSLDASAFSSLVSVQKASLVPGLFLVPWLLRSTSSALLGAVALAVYGCCTPAMFSAGGPGVRFMAPFVLFGVSCEIVFIALNALTQAVDPADPGPPNTMYRLVRAGASVAAPWAAAQMLSAFGEAHLFGSLPLLLAAAMLAAAATLRYFPLPGAAAAAAAAAAAPPPMVVLKDLPRVPAAAAAAAAPAAAAVAAPVAPAATASAAGKRAAGLGLAAAAAAAASTVSSLLAPARDGLGDWRAVLLIVLMQVIGTTWVTVQAFIFYYVTEDLGHDVRYFGGLKSAAKLGGFCSITLVGLGISRLGMKPTMLLCQVGSAAFLGLMAASRRWAVYGYIGHCMLSDAIPMISSIWVSSLALGQHGGGGGGGGGGGATDATNRKASVFAMKKVIGRAINSVGLMAMGAVSRSVGSKPAVFAICSAVGFVTTCFMAMVPAPPPMPESPRRGQPPKAKPKSE